MGLDEAAQAEPQKIDTHPIVESDTVDATVDATVPKRSVNPNCLWTLLVTKVFTTSWFLNHFKTASSLTNRLH